MRVQAVKMDADKARELYYTYKKHQNYERPEDYAIMRAYQLLSLGKTIIQALQSIKNAGLNSDGLPRLAIARAHNKVCKFSRSSWNSCSFHGDANSYSAKWNRIDLQHDFFPNSEQHHNVRELGKYGSAAKAPVPHIPPQYLPKRGLANYHILWEAIWEKAPPGDPYLLRRIDESDMWVVLAAWDLTSVEQAAMRTAMLVH